MMKSDEKPNDASWMALAICCALYLTAIWVYHLGSAAAGFPAFRDQHLGAALLFAKNGIDLLHPIVPGFNAAGTPMPLEVPIWQAAAALGIRLTGGWWGGANLASLLIFSSCLLPFFALARQWMGSMAAWWTLLLFLAQPVIFYQAGVASTDGASLASLIWFLYAVDGVIRTRTIPFFVLALVTGVWCAVSKLPFFIEAGLASGLMLIWHAPRSIRAWCMVAAVGVAGALALFFWENHVEAMLQMGEFRYRGVTLSEVPAFYFGDLKYRLSPATYARASWIILNVFFGSFVLVGLFFWGVWLSKKSWGWAMLGGFAAVACVFFKLIFTHKHYYLMLTPAVAMLTAAAVNDLVNRLAFQRTPKILVFALTGFLFLATAQGIMGLEVLGAFDPYPKQMANIVREKTRPEDRMLMSGGGWGGDIFIRSDRQGLSIDSTAAFADKEKQKRLKELGYTLFVGLSESPLLHAQQQTNPGSFSRHRVLWQDATSEVDKNWPILYSDENIVIKKIVWDETPQSP